MALTDEQVNGDGATEFLCQLAQAVNESLGREAVQVFLATLEDNLMFVYQRRYANSKAIDCMEAMRVEFSKRFDTEVIHALGLKRQPENPP